MKPTHRISTSFASNQSTPLEGDWSTCCRSSRHPLAGILADQPALLHQLNLAAEGLL
jgi:hypothetical protein